MTDMGLRQHCEVFGAATGTGPQGMTDEEVIRRFHQITYARWNPLQTYWRGHLAIKSPMDLQAYHEILHEVRPDLIVETGSFSGGSALFLADMCELNGKGRVISIDIEDTPRPEHPRLAYLHGDSVAMASVVRCMVEPSDVVLVILDSDHHETHVMAEMAAYAPLVTNGSYLIVEDTNINGHPVLPDYGPGPMEAVVKFMAANSEQWIQDTARERFLLTCNPGGFLKRMA